MILTIDLLLKNIEKELAILKYIRVTPPPPKIPTIVDFIVRVLRRASIRFFDRKKHNEFHIQGCFQQGSRGLDGGE